MDNILKLAGRIAIAGFFAWAAAREAMNPSAVMSGVKSSGLPAPGLVFAVVLILMAAASVMVIAGYKARYGALALLILFLPAAFLLHIDLAGGQYGPMLGNLAIAGGLIYIYAAGAGGIGMKKG